MYEVAEITFEELGFEMKPGVFCGMFSGTAYVDSDGAVCAIELDGYCDGKAVRTRFEIPNSYQNKLDWADYVMLALSDHIANHYSTAIHDALDDWAATRGIREYEPQE